MRRSHESQEWSFGISSVVLPALRIHVLPRNAMPSCGSWVSVCLSVTFVYCVETAKYRNIVAMECVRIGNRMQAFKWYHFQLPEVRKFYMS